MESIEKVTRHHLQSHRNHHIPIQQVIIGDALKDHAEILSAWEIVAPLPSKYEHTALSYCEQLLHYGQMCAALHLLRDGMNNLKRNSTNMAQEAL